MAWPTVTDDVGDFISGTVFNQALSLAMKAYIDGLVVSPSWPAISAANIIDEVVAARGSKATLDDRLDVALNDDGTPKSVAGQATETQVGRQANSGDFARNRFMDLWSDGTAVPPDYYTFPMGGAIAQAGVGMADTTQIGAGVFCAKITSGAGAASELRQLVIHTTEFDDFLALKGRKVNFTVRGKASSANMFRLIVYDGVTPTTSGYNTTSADEDLSVQHTISSGGPTYLLVSVEVAMGGNIAYIGAFSVTFGDVLPTRFDMPALTKLTAARVEPGTYRQVAKNTANIQSINGENGFTWPMPASALGHFGSSILVEASGAFAATANNKSIRLYVGTNYLTVVPVLVHNVATNKWHIWGRLIRISSTSVVFDGFVTYDATDGATPTMIHWAQALAGGATDLTTAQDVKVNQVTTVIGDSTIARVFFTVVP